MTEASGQARAQSSPEESPEAAQSQPRGNPEATQGVLRTFSRLSFHRRVIQVRKKEEEGGGGRRRRKEESNGEHFVGYRACRLL